jgi:hypothetical protein
MKDRPTFSIEDSLKAFRVQFCLFVANTLPSAVNYLKLELESFSLLVLKVHTLWNA